MKVLSSLIGAILLASSALAKDVSVQVNSHAVRLDVVWSTQLNPRLPTIVFESGLGARGTRDWRRVVRVMPSDVRFVRYDRPGHGGSEPDDESPTPRHISQVLHDALKQAGIPPPYVLVGHSLGGARIRMFAALYPDDVVGMVFVDPTADFLRGGADQDLHDIFEPLGLGAREQNEFSDMTRVAETVIPDIPKPVRAELEMARALANDGFPEFKVLPPLRDIPVVVLAGESNAEWPSSVPGLSFDLQRWERQWQTVRIATLRRFAESLPEGTFLETPNSSHQVQNSEPELVAWAIERATYPNVLRRLQRAFATGGVHQLTREYQAIKAVYPAHEVDEEALNYTGDRLATTDEQAGIALFELNVKDHPRSSRAHEFLADAYAGNGKKDLAIQNYQRALALDPKNEDVRSKLTALRK